MRLLVLTNNPRRPSFRQRIELYIDLLRASGIEAEVARLPGPVLERARTIRRCAAYDAVFLHKKKLNLFELLLLKRYCRKLIYDFDDAVMYKPSAPNRRSFSPLVRFALTVRQADLVIAGNRYLAGQARKYNPNVEILPTGLDLGEYRTRTSAPATADRPVRLVWIGSRSTLRYLAELRPALDEIGSRFDNVVLRIISDRFLELQRMPVEKCPWSYRTQFTDLATADIGLAPLPDNPFTRGKCGFKILQYAAAGLPVVASPVGVNCDYVQQNVTGLFASEAAQWVDAISRLVRDPAERIRLGRAARESVEKFDLKVIGQRLAELLLRCAGRP